MKKKFLLISLLLAYGSEDFIAASTMTMSKIGNISPVQQASAPTYKGRFLQSLSLGDLTKLIPSTKVNGLTNEVFKKVYGVAPGVIKHSEFKINGLNAYECEGSAIRMFEIYSDLLANYANYTVEKLMDVVNESNNIYKKVNKIASADINAFVLGIKSFAENLAQNIKYFDYFGISGNSIDAIRTAMNALSVPGATASRFDNLSPIFKYIDDSFKNPSYNSLHVDSLMVDITGISVFNAAGAAVAGGNAVAGGIAVVVPAAPGYATSAVFKSLDPIGISIATVIYDALNDTGKYIRGFIEDLTVSGVMESKKSVLEGCLDKFSNAELAFLKDIASFSKHITTEEFVVAPVLVRTNSVDVFRSKLAGIPGAGIHDLELPLDHAIIDKTYSLGGLFTFNKNVITPATANPFTIDPIFVTQLSNLVKGLSVKNPARLKSVLIKLMADSHLSAVKKSSDAYTMEENSDGDLKVSVVRSEINLSDEQGSLSFEENCQNFSSYSKLGTLDNSQLQSLAYLTVRGVKILADGSITSKIFTPDVLESLSNLKLDTTNLLSFDKFASISVRDLSDNDDNKDSVLFFNLLKRVYQVSKVSFDSEKLRKESQKLSLSVSDLMKTFLSCSVIKNNSNPNESFIRFFENYNKMVSNRNSKGYLVDSVMSKLELSGWKFNKILIPTDMVAKGLFSNGFCRRKGYDFYIPLEVVLKQLKSKGHTLDTIVSNISNSLNSVKS